MDDTREVPVIITHFTLVHFLVGVCSYISSLYTDLSFSHSLLFFSFLHLLYEIKDMYTSYYLVLDGPYNNSLQNSIADQIFAMIGFVIASKVFTSPDQPVVFFVSIMVAIYSYYHGLP